MKKASERKDLQREFERDMHDDLKVLQEELGAAKRLALASKEVVFTAVLATTAVATGVLTGSFLLPAALTATGVAVELGGIYRTYGQLASARKGIMKQHPMAYMYEVEKFSRRAL